MKTVIEAPFTLVSFRFKMPIVYTTPAFSRSKTETADPVLVWKLQGCVSVQIGKKGGLLKTMAWLPTFALRNLDNRVNKNIMLIVVPIHAGTTIDMYR